jgi:hypothetical protein
VVDFLAGQIALLHTAFRTLPLNSIRNCYNAMNPHNAIVLPKPHRAYHNSGLSTVSFAALIASSYRKQDASGRMAELPCRPGHRCPSMAPPMRRCILPLRE